MKTKTFDCVEMKHQGAEAIRKRLRGKTKEKKLEYWKKRTEVMRKRQEEILQLRNNKTR